MKLETWVKMRVSRYINTMKEDYPQFATIEFAIDDLLDERNASAQRARDHFVKDLVAQPATYEADQQAWVKELHRITGLTV